MVQISGYVLVNVTGLASAGTVSAQGLKAGDRIIQASSSSLPGNVNIFEAVVSVDDELQQFTAFGSSTAVAFEILALRLLSCRKLGRRLPLGSTWRTGFLDGGEYRDRTCASRRTRRVSTALPYRSANSP